MFASFFRFLYLVVTPKPAFDIPPSPSDHVYYSNIRRSYPSRMSFSASQSGFDSFTPRVSSTGHSTSTHRSTFSRSQVRPPSALPRHPSYPISSADGKELDGSPVDLDQYPQKTPSTGNGTIHRKEEHARYVLDNRSTSMNALRSRLSKPFYPSRRSTVSYPLHHSQDGRSFPRTSSDLSPILESSPQFSNHAFASPAPHFHLKDPHAPRRLTAGECVGSRFIEGQETLNCDSDRFPFYASSSVQLSDGRMTKNKPTESAAAVVPLSSFVPSGVGPTGLFQHRRPVLEHVDASTSTSDLCVFSSKYPSLDIGISSALSGPGKCVIDGLSAVRRRNTSCGVPAEGSAGSVTEIAPVQAPGDRQLIQGHDGTEVLRSAPILRCWKYAWSRIRSGGRSLLQISRT